MRRLVADAGGPTEWAKQYGGDRWTQAQVSQWISETKPKGIGNRLARDLEAAMSLPRGLLDQPPEASKASHAARPDFETMAGAVEVLRHYLELTGQRPDLISDPVYLEIMYEAVEAFGGDVRPDNVLDITKWAAKRAREDGGSSATDEVQGARRAVGGAPA